MRTPKIFVASLTSAIATLVSIHASAQYWEVWDLTTHPGDVVIHAANGVGQSGSNQLKSVDTDVVLAGDASGDGIDDLAVSRSLILGSRNLAPEYDLRGTNAAPPTMNLILTDTSLNEYYNIYMYGDLNGDGKSELYIRESGNLSQAPHRFFLFTGRTQWPNTLAPNSTNSLEISAADQSHLDFLGSQPALHDFNGDGMVDFMYWWCPFPDPRASITNVYRGDPAWLATGTLLPTSPHMFTIFADPIPGTNLVADGSPFEVKADLNRDGFDDFIVRTFETLQGSGQGGLGIKVFPGSQNSTQYHDGQPSFIQINELPFVQYADVGVGSIGDWDGDGWPDIGLVTSDRDHGPDGTRTDCGAVRLYFGLGKGPSPRELNYDQSDVVIYGPYPGAREPTNFPLFAAADLNGDGIDDLIVRAFIGDTYVFYGRQSWPHVIDLAKEEPDSKIIGAGYIPLDGRTKNGTRVRWDVNGDGIDDYVGQVGAPSGQSVVIYGGPDFPRLFNALTDLDQADLVFPHGTIQQTGDYNGDGIKDLFVDNTLETPWAGDPSRGNMRSGDIIFGRTPPQDVWIAEFLTAPGNGTPANPYRSLNHALRAVRPGGTVHLVSFGSASITQARTLNKPMRITVN